MTAKSRAADQVMILRYDSAPASTDRDGTLTVTLTGQFPRAFAVTELPADRPGRAFVLIAGDGTTHEVFLGENGPDDCGCPRFGRAGACVHAAGLRAALAAGVILHPLDHADCDWGCDEPNDSWEGREGWWPVRVRPPGRACRNDPARPAPGARGPSGSVGFPC